MVMSKRFSELLEQGIPPGRRLWLDCDFLKGPDRIRWVSSGDEVGSAADVSGATLFDVLVIGSVYGLTRTQPFDLRLWRHRLRPDATLVWCVWRGNWATVTAHHFLEFSLRRPPFGRGLWRGFATSVEDVCEAFLMLGTKNIRVFENPSFALVSADYDLFPLSD